ncbi:MAG TPA: hypothetical protein PLT82_09745 [Candidatus Hydrogenedens sp.]|nr:hypothetical protein [Candidatus Hydrogenedens sp.]HOL19493.1 hypothetical protein [Candidatus Hydrogenedens sp.]HPP59403.1 hypothetical protein [Candidatus Hydrogenedens sp.]
MPYTQIERTLLLHPDVVEVCTIAVPKPTKQKEAKVFVVLREGATINPDELMKFLKSQVNGQSEKIDITIIDKLPKSPAGVVLRRELVKRC